MQILRTAQELSTYLKNTDCKPGCFADTSFLYGVAYRDDRFFESANDILDLLSENLIPLYANVISRMEFVDLILRKQITEGCVTMFNEIERERNGSKLFNLLKNIRDRHTAGHRENQSYKIGETQLKNLRRLVSTYSPGFTWKEFCHKYTGALLVSEWKMIEEELGLNFVEILEDATSELFKEPLLWADMVQVMGMNGMRGPDAMIVNLFLKSNFQLLITGDSDFEDCLRDSGKSSADKAVLIL